MHRALPVSFFQCQVHVVEYIRRGPLQMRMWEERDDVTHGLLSIHQSIQNYEQHRVIWMAGLIRQ